MKSAAGLLVTLALLIGASSMLGGCATQDGLALNRAAPCSGGVWISARRGPTGRWQPGHWYCPQ
jgi:hypothetical protein